MNAQSHECEPHIYPDLKSYIFLNHLNSSFKCIFFFEPIKVPKQEPTLGSYVLHHAFLVLHAVLLPHSILSLIAPFNLGLNRPITSNFAFILRRRANASILLSHPPLQPSELHSIKAFRGEPIPLPTASDVIMK
ncbi:hypothetical protein GQ457_13G000100 [Hibiscus cannabinus]